MKQRKKLIDILLEEKLITQKDFEEAMQEQKMVGVPLQKILLKKGYISSESLAKALAKQLDIPYIKLSEAKIDPQIINMLSEDTARQYQAIPVRMESDNLYVAFASPLNLPAVDKIKLFTGCQIKQMVASEEEIDGAIDKYYKVGETSKQAIVDMRMEKLKERKSRRQEAVVVEEEVGKIEDMPVVRLVNDLIMSAINAKASDIHLEPQDPEMITRYRIDGILHDIMTIPKHIETAVISRVKVLANMDITEHRRPQDGHITIKRDGKDYDIRVSTVMAVNGEKTVMRILEKSTMLLGLEKLGLNSFDEETFRQLIAKPYGMILVTGPTGSGKTTSLYAVLQQLDSKATNIITIEEPVEYRLDRITQIQVDPGAKMSFATGLRTILRQDPDIVMVGEIRDRETAEIAIQAALTGHLVFSTLHTNDAPSAVTRLVDMGIEPFLISSTVIGAIAQRLCRTVCPQCKTEYEPTKEETKFLQEVGYSSKKLKLVKGKGCDLCFHTGYRGRAGIFEIMKVSDGIRKLILERKSVLDIKKFATKEGMKTLQENGLQKIVDEVSTIEEVKRVVYMEQ